MTARLRAARRIAASLALVALLSVHVVSLYRQAPRRANFDEAEYLHASWLMSHGQRLYRDFIEDHSPFLFVLLRVVTPGRSERYPALNVFRFLTRGRALVAVLGTLAVLCAAVLAARITRSAAAPVITAAALLGSGWTWQRAIADVRNDPPTLFLFWLGLLLLLWRREATPRGAWRAGIGIGLIAVVALWNPKWPLLSVLAGLIYLVTLRDLARSHERGRLMTVALAAPLALLALAMGVILATTTLRDYVFFTFRYNAAFLKWFQSTPMLNKWFANEHSHCPLTFRGRWPAIGLSVVGAALAVGPVRRAWSGLDVPRAVIALAMAVLAGMEVRFVYCYPRLWAQHYLMWAFTLAIVYGCVPGAISAVARAWKRPFRARTLVAFECMAMTVALGLFVRGAHSRLE